MPFSDLDLEFEDDDNSVPTPPAKVEATGTSPTIKKLEEARAVQPQVKSAGTTPSIPRPAPAAVSGTGAHKVPPQSDVHEEMRRIQIEADVKVQLAEFKLTYLADMLSDVKLVDHQIGQLLNRINAKHPDVKNELLMIKKILADFVAKKRK